MTEKEFKDNIVEYLSLRKLLEPRIEITDEEIKAYFEENKEAIRHKLNKFKQVIFLLKTKKQQKKSSKNLKTAKISLNLPKSIQQIHRMQAMVAN